MSKLKKFFETKELVEKLHVDGKHYISSERQNVLRDTKERGEFFDIAPFRLRFFTDF